MRLKVKLGKTFVPCLACLRLAANERSGVTPDEKIQNS